MTMKHHPNTLLYAIIVHNKLLTVINHAMCYFKAFKGGHIGLLSLTKRDLETF